MIAVNHEKKAIFIRIPKTASTYLMTIFRYNYNFKYTHKISEFHDNITPKNKNDCIQGNKNIDFLNYCKNSKIISNELSMDDILYDNYIKFSFVRNPYERIVSGWKFLQERYDNMESLDYVPFQICSFKDFLKLNTDDLSNIEYVHTFMTQSFNINNNNVTIIGKYENLEDDILKILLNLGFNECEINHEKQIMNNTNHEHYKEYYDNESIQLVNVLFKEDFENFNYKIINNVDELKQL